MKSLEKVLLLGSGGLRISQAGEFDYSGSQAIKALKEEGIKVVLVNPNIATVQTDEGMADTVYLQPLNEKTVTQIIEAERPQAILLGFGGQTALNLGLKLEETGVLERYQVAVLGTSVTSIRTAEDRALFKDKLDEIEVKTAQSIAVSSVEDAVRAAQEIGYPVMMRSAFSLGGMGSGVVSSEASLRVRAQEALSGAPQILIEENLLGWSEFEYEIVRDSAGNVLTVCNMENFDPMGIHTGESIVVSPSQSLNNQEYHFLREIALKVAQHFEIIGECNIQYAYNLKTGDYRVIEINPRLSRSSALASKATGYPLAFVAAKLALGYKLHELKNSVTERTCAFFEPALDYIVVKIPRWDIHKLKDAERRIGTEMKSVGEVMAIGRSFPEALQKAVGMLNIGATDLVNYPHQIVEPMQEVQYATDRRLFAIFQAFLDGASIDEVNHLSGIDPWFLEHIHSIAMCTHRLRETQTLSFELISDAKKLGFSDKSIARYVDSTEENVRQYRRQEGIFPVIKQVDTLAGEFDAQTNYLYLTYHGETHDIEPSKTPAVMILGSGPYSIGSSVEFDWCAVTAARTLRKMGIPSIIVNSNPETVSTDYDESDRLYFEQLSLERVRDIADFENMRGVIVSVGGQTSNNLVMPLSQYGYPILGTEAENIHQAENREAFSAMLNQLDIDQPRWDAATSLDKAKAFASYVGYPVLIRPSFVLSGAAMNVVFSEKELEKYLSDATSISPDYPVVISEFIRNGKELEVDGVAQNGRVVIDAISEHIENAGVHSGDATIVLPPQRLYLETIRRTKKITREIVAALNISGPFNMQFIAKNNRIQVIECNLRASRSFPFVTKATGHNLIRIATEVMLGAYQEEEYETLELDYVAVKTPQFSYSRLKGANPVAHVEMASTGEVGCLGEDLLDAFYRSWQATEQTIRGKRLLVSVGGLDKKEKLLPLLRKLDEKGWMLYTTSGTHDFLAKHGIATHYVYKVSDDYEPSVASLIANQSVDLVINLPRSSYGQTGHQQTDGFLLRRLAIDHHVPLMTNLQTTEIILQCLCECFEQEPKPRAWQAFMQMKKKELM